MDIRLYENLNLIYLTYLVYELATEERALTLSQ
jgi:hypothetical protein